MIIKVHDKCFYIIPHIVDICAAVRRKQCDSRCKNVFNRLVERGNLLLNESLLLLYINSHLHGFFDDVDEREGKRGKSFCIVQIQQYGSLFDEKHVLENSNKLAGVKITKKEYNQIPQGQLCELEWDNLEGGPVTVLVISVTDGRTRKRTWRTIQSHLLIRETVKGWCNTKSMKRCFSSLNAIMAGILLID